MNIIETTSHFGAVIVATADTPELSVVFAPEDSDSVVRDREYLTITYFVDYKGYEAQGIIRYNKAYEDEGFERNERYSAWDTPLVTLESFDCMNGGIGWEGQSAIIALLLEFNEHIIERMGLLG